jgi:hypothetical protein
MKLYFNLRQEYFDSPIYPYVLALDIKRLDCIEVFCFMDNNILKDIKKSRLYDFSERTK